MRKFFTFFLLMWSVVCLTGCPGTVQPQVRVERILVAPQDNLLVDCDVEAPPAKETYLQNFKIGALAKITPTVPFDNTSPADSISYMTQYVERLLRKAETRESLQTNLNAKNYQNLDVCNKRWKELRNWKATTLNELNNRKKE